MEIFESMSIRTFLLPSPILSRVEGSVKSAMKFILIRFENLKKKKKKEGFQIGVKRNEILYEYYSAQREIRNAISPTTSSLSLPFLFIGHCCPSPDILAIFRKVSNTERERGSVLTTDSFRVAA